MSKIDWLPKISHQRNRWLVGGSALAAAAASLALLPGQAYAQNRQQTPITLQTNPLAPMDVSAGPSVRQLPQMPAPLEIRTPADRQTVPVTTIAPRAYSDAVGISLNTQIVPVISPTNAPAQQIPTTISNISAPISSGPAVSAITTLSSTTAPSNGDTDTNGINVAASANYFASEVDFRPGSAFDEVEIFGDSAIINWTTFGAGTAGGEVTFLAAGQRLNFISAAGGYTVLNRIFTPGVDASVRIDGTVTSRTNSGDLIGGNIWFYSPGGLIIGASSTFNVGSLVLTSSNLNAISPTMNFTGVAEANTAVVIESGAQISALEPNSYFAVVAPRVVQGGSVDVNGSVAYVGAEQAQLTINNGLFDISVGVGSSDANGVVHTGTTTGAAATPTVDIAGQITNADARGIYMVAVPKNTAISMLVGGTVGYQPAMAASLADNGSIILSAGTGTVTGGTVIDPTAQIDVANAVAGGNVVLDSAILTSSTDVYASDKVTLAGSGTSLLSSGSDGRGAYDLNVVADGGILLSLQDSATINVDGDLTMKSAGSIAVDLTSTAGTLSVGGDFLIDTTARGADDFFTVRNNGGTGIAADAVAGSISLVIGGGTNLSIGGNLVLDASAQGGKGEAQNGSSTAGDISADFTGTGSTAISGLVVLDAQALAAQDGKIGGNGPGLIGSDSTGGNVSLTLGGAGFSAGGLFINASADASTGSDSSVPQSNDAIAGAITVNITGGNNQFGDVVLISQANSADSFDDAGANTVGLATRGSVGLNVTNFDTFLGIAGNVNIDVSTYGVIAPPTGDTVSIIVNNVGTSGGMFVDGNLGIDTVSSGGSEVSLTESGSVLLEVADGQLFAGGISIDAFASANGGGSGFLGGGTGQNFQGGDVILRANANGRIDGGFGSIDSSAVGAINTAGDATGGSITLEANDGAIAFQSGVELRAGARGGAGSDPLDGSAAIARGGEVTLSVSGPSGSLELGDISANTDASILFNTEAGSVEFSGQGGSAVAGDVVFNLDGGSLTANFLDISSKGSGGSGGSLAPMFAGFSTGLPSAGDGGLGQGGIVTFNLNGSDVTINDLVISADGIGGSGADGDFESGTSGGRGGDAIGGAAVFNALAGTLTTNNLIISAQGNTPNGGGDGGDGSGSEGGDGGNATGGSATFNLVGTAMISAGRVLVTTDGYGGRGGSSSATIDAMSNILPGQAAGNGGDGTGGTSIFNHTSGDISFNDLTASAAGIGGDGGGSSGFSVGDSTGAGGAGGNGTGGIATINLNQDDGSDPTYFVIAEAVGGAGGGGLFSGDGGAALGGTANLTINNSAIVLVAATVSGSAAGGNAGFADTAGGTAGSGGNALGGTANLNLNGALASISSSEPIRILADAFGGNGADGPVAASGANGGDGGAGGSAAGGSAQIVLTGAGASLIVESQLALLSANGLGGQGGVGGISFDGLGGTGGLGGDATGGSVTLQANSGTTLTLDEISGPFTLTVTGTGGAGGQGGNGGLSTGSAPGIGGNGGTGVGGSPTLRAIGGTISGTNVALAGIGFGGNGGAGGLSQTVAQGAAGNGGNGIGGSPTLELFNGSPGIISLGDLTVTANGIAGTGTITGIDAGGLVIMRDLSTEAGGVFSFGSLTVDATGFAEAPGGGGLIFIGGSGTNTVAGNMNVDVTGDITYAFDGNSQITVGGNTTLFATGDILVTHINNTGAVVSIDTAGNVTAIANGNFTADTGSIIGAGGEMFIIADGNISADDLRAVPVIVLFAGGNVLLRNALASGPQGMSNVGGIFIDAGVDNGGSGPVYDPNFNVTITGSVQSYSDILVNAGGSAIFTPTANVAADNSLVVRTGDDIIVQAGAALSSANNPTAAVDPFAPFITGPNLSLLAGSITILTGPILTPISSIVSAGSLVSNSGAVILNANAIDGLGGTIAGSSLSAEINDAPGAGLPQSDDAGLLGVSCVEGNVCLGNISADNRIEVGQNSNNDVIRLVIEQGTVSANDVLITIRDAIVMGSNGIPTIINAANSLAVESLTGDINLVDAVISSNQITIAAAGSLLGNGSLTSANDIGITVGQDVNALLISAGGQLTSVAGVGGLAEAQYSVPGSINVITYTQGGATPLRVVADGSNSFGTINMAGAQNITLIGGNAGAGTGDVFLGAATGAGNIALTGDNVGIGNLTAGGAITANAIAGAINFGSATAGTNLTMTASGAIIGGNLGAGGTLNLNGSSIAIGNASANTIQFISGTDILFDSLSSPNAISLSALNGLVGGNTGAGDIDSGGDVDLVAQEIALGDITSGGSVSANATAGDASFGTVDAANNIAVIASGTPSLTNAISGGDTSITGSAVAFANGTVGGDLSLTATAGNVDASGSVSVAGGIALAATGNIGFASLAAQGGDFTADAGGTIIFNGASATGALDFMAGNSITTAGAITGGQVTLGSGGAINAASITSTAAAGGGIDVSGTNGITVGSLTGNGAVLQSTAGAIRVTNDINLSGLLEAEGRSVFLRAVNALNVRAIATAGDIDIAAGGNLGLLDISATGNVVLASTGGSVAANAATTSGITSSGGNVNVTAVNNFMVNSAVNAANTLTINVGGLLDLQASATGGAINVLAGDLNIGTAGSLGRSDLTGSIVITTLGDIVLGGAGGGAPIAGVLTIDNNEFSRIFSGGDLSLIAQPGASGGGNITVNTLGVLVGSGTGTPQDGNIGPVGGLFLQAGAAIDMIGVATMTNAGANSVFSLAATTIIRVDPASGALIVRNANGGLAGQLELIAPRIEAISDLARLDISSASTLGVNIRLGTNDGAINNAGYFSAADLFFTVDNALLIQNSGGSTAFNDRRGFSANNVTIDASGPAAVIVINGVVGSLTDFEALGAVGVPVLFDPGSTINGCLILNVASCAGTSNIPGNPVTRNPVKDLIDEVIDPRSDDNPGLDDIRGDNPGDDIGGILVEMRKQGLRQDDPLLDDPVTGAGNEDLWVSGPDCEGVDADSEACAANGETEPAE